MFLRLCGPPSIPLSFSLAAVRSAAYTLSQTASIHRLLRGLPGYLILFDTHAFVHQRQTYPGKLPSQSEFCAISMHFTATRHIPPASLTLKTGSFNGNPTVEPQHFTADLPARLRTL